ncbi:MAG: hypothetical protein JWM27_4117 [Gemmatimonadetes bacterium]|nr:hypothetical protein [Gemmatimonadota bacterium]
MDSLRRKIAIAYGSGVLVLGVGAASLAGVALWRRATEWVVHTHRVMEGSERLMSLLKDAETGQRGYLITGDTTYLRPYASAARDLPAQLRAVDALVADNPVQHARVDSLRGVAVAKLAEMARTVEVRRRAGADSAARLVATNRGRHLMDDARALALHVEASERALLRERTARQHRMGLAVLGLIGLGTAAAVLLSLLTTRAIRRDVAERDAAGAQLARQSTELQEQTAELEMQTEELTEEAVRSQALSERLRDALAARTRFYAAMSHELRTPINAILGFNDLLLAGVYGDLHEGQRLGIERSQRATRHLTELVGDVLDLSRLEAGRAELAPEAVPVAALVADVVATVQPLAAQRGSELAVDAACVRTVWTDPRRVRQILLNLLSNAIKFGDGNPLEVRYVDEGGDGVAVEVRDAGRGIATADAERIFDEFVQLDNPARGELAAQGTGLGLSISRRLAELLGGTLTLVSAPGAGSTFTLRLPSRLPDPPPPSAEEGGLEDVRFVGGRSGSDRSVDVRSADVRSVDDPMADGRLPEGRASVDGAESRP